MRYGAELTMVSSQLLEINNQSITLGCCIASAEQILVKRNHTLFFQTTLRDDHIPRIHGISYLYTALAHRQNLNLQNLQLVLYFSTLLYIRHSHYLDHQARPASEMLRSLSLARFGIILFPCEPCPFPFLEDVLYKVSAERGVELGCPLLVWARGLGKILCKA